MSVVSDPSPLIFLGKIKRLGWLKSLFKGPYYLPELVRNEILIDGIPPSEMDYLTKALNGWTSLPWQPRVSRLAGGLSVSDIAILEVAKKVDAEWVLADEKALRQVLTARQHKVIGTLGIHLMACRKEMISAGEAKEAVDELIANHRFRISAQTYRRFLKFLGLERT